MAISKMQVSAKMGNDFKTEVSCSHPFIIDQPKAAGGTDLGANPLEVYLSSLAGCVCAIGRIIAKQRRLEVNGLDVKVEGDIDKDYLLGKTQEGRAGFVELRVFVEVDAPMSAEEKDAFVEDIEKRCPVADNISNTTTIKRIVS